MAILKEQWEEAQSSRAISRKNLILTLSGLVILALGLFLVQYGWQGLSTPHSCPANQLGCTTTAYVPQLFETFGGFSMVLLGSGLLILRGRFSASKGIAFGVVIVSVIIAIILI